MYERLLNEPPNNHNGRIVGEYDATQKRNYVGNRYDFNGVRYSDWTLCESGVFWFFSFRFCGRNTRWPVFSDEFCVPNTNSKKIVK